MNENKLHSLLSICTLNNGTGTVSSKAKSTLEAIKVNKVVFSLKSLGIHPSKYCNFWSCLMLRVSPQVFICPTSALQKPQKGSKWEQNSLSCTWYSKTLRNHTFQQCCVQNQKVAKAFLSFAILDFFPKKIQFLGKDSRCKMSLAFFGSFSAFPPHLPVSPSALWKD